MQRRHCKQFVSKRDFHVHLRHDFSCFARWDCLLTLVTRTNVCCSLFCCRYCTAWLAMGTLRTLQCTYSGHDSVTQDCPGPRDGMARTDPANCSSSLQLSQIARPVSRRVSSTPAQGSRVLFRVNATKDFAGDLKAFVTIFLEIRCELCIKNIDCK